MKRSDRIIGWILCIFPLSFYAGCLIGNPWLWAAGLAGTLTCLGINWGINKRKEYWHKRAAAVRYKPGDPIHFSARVPSSRV